jgi:hypothetical protein
MASTYLSRTQSTSPTSAKIGTISFWVKRGALGDQHILNGYTDVNNRAFLNFTSDDRLQVGQKNSGTTVYQIEETPQRRDVSAWYHCVFAFDTTDGTASNRLKLYVNGSQVTDFTTNNEIEVNEDIKFFNLANLQLGRAGGGSNYFDGSLAHFHYADGTAYDADTFGETDATTGIWKPKTAPSVTYGTNGFFLKFENSGAFGTDSSGNANNFTVNGTMTQTIDTPSNVFATLNPLDNFYAGSTFSNGNNTITTGSSNETYNTSTFGVSSGKWYWEYKFTGTTQQYMTGIASKLSTSTSDPLGYQHAEEYAINQSGSGIYSNSVTTPYGSGNLASGDIISVALDLDNNNLYFAKNGQWGSGSAWDQTFSTALAYSITDPANTTLGAYFVAVGDWNTSGNSIINMNFGNGYFGTTAVSSAENPDDGIGIFEYSVPTGYKALCTKSINAQEYD